MIDEQNTQSVEDEDVEGHRLHHAAVAFDAAVEDDDVSGQKLHTVANTAGDDEEDDVEGHRFHMRHH